jgi:hypothetical protein
MARKGVGRGRTLQEETDFLARLGGQVQSL